MENDDYSEIKDAVWQQVDSQLGEIKFRKNNKNRKVKVLFKAVAFVVIAAISGGASGAYIVNKKIGNIVYPNNYNFLNPPDQTVASDIPKNTITKVADDVGPAVVGISNKVEGFFGEQSTGSGSGIIFDSRGYIVTNNHVIEGADKVTVKLSNGKVFTAKYVGADPNSDLAVIKIEAKYLPVAKFGDSSKVKVGDVAVAIGNPLGEEFAGSVTAGIISAVNRKIQYGNTSYQLLQTDAAINPGNSGGALCNEAGEVIGINCLKIGSLNAESLEGLGFAISINEAKDVLQKLMKDIKAEDDNIAKPKIGMNVGDALANQSEGLKGALVKEVDKGSSAEKAGIKPSDIIVQADQAKITTAKDLDLFLCSRKSGDIVTCKVWRQGSILEVKVTLSEK